MHRLALAVMPLALASWALTAVSPATAADGDALDVGLTGYADLVLDEAHGHVFISQGSDKIVVTDLNGKPLAPITGLPESRGMSLDEDGSTLWVAVGGADEVAAIDTTTLEVTTFPIGANTCPVELALTSGLVWVYAGCYYDSGTIFALDPATGSVTPVTDDNAPRPYLTASPELPGRMFLVARGSSPQTIVEYDVTGLPTPSLTVHASHRLNTKLGTADNLMVMPGGASIVTGYGKVFNTSNLGLVSQYTPRFYGSAVARRADGTMSFGGGDGLTVMKPASSSTFRNYLMYDRSVGVGGMAWGTTKLYAVTHGRDYPSEPYRLRVITPRRKSSITVTTPSTRYRLGDRVPVTATLVGGATHGKVAIYANTFPYDGPRVLVASGLVDSNGRFATHYRAQRRTRFSVSYAGDASTEGSANRSHEVFVRAAVDTTMSRYRSRRGSAYVYKATDTAIMKVKVRPDHGGECVTLEVMLRFGGDWQWGRGIGCLTLSSHSVARVGLRGSRDLVKHPVRLRVKYRGDLTNLGTQTPWTYVTFVR